VHLHWTIGCCGRDHSLPAGLWHPDTLVALNAGGNIRWQLRVGEAYSTPALAEDGTIYICTMDGDLVVVSPEGSERWRQHLDEEFWSSAVVGSDGTVYVVTGDSLFAVNPDGTRGWSRHGGGDMYHCLALADNGTIYYVTNPDSGTCLLAVNPMVQRSGDTRRDGRMRRRSSARTVPCTWVLTVITVYALSAARAHSCGAITQATGC